MAVTLDLRAGQHVSRAQGLLGGGGLAALPGLIGLECHHAQRGERGVLAPAARAPLTCTTQRRAATEQPAQQATQAAARTGATTQQATEQSAQVATRATLGCAAARTVHRALAGSQQLFEQIAGVHDDVLIEGIIPFGER
ncbi:hypothetical protein D3C73_1118770 [compost metagenome]